MHVKNIDLINCTRYSHIGFTIILLLLPIIILKTWETYMHHHDSFAKPTYVTFSSSRCVVVCASENILLCYYYAECCCITSQQEIEGAHPDNVKERSRISLRFNRERTFSIYISTFSILNIVIYLYMFAEMLLQQFMPWSVKITREYWLLMRTSMLYLCSEE